MKKISKLIFMLLFAFMLIAVFQNVNAQCAMCTTSVETNAQSGSTTANGLNGGIMYLLAAPYLAVAVIGYIWYKKYRRKNVPIQMRGERLHLN